MKTALQFLAIILISGNIFAQSATLVSISAKVVGFKTNEPLAYATAYNLNSGYGTATNTEGKFILHNNKIGDSVRISFIGYKDTILTVDEKPTHKIKLKPQSYLLDEIPVLADNSYLYVLISRIRKKYLRQNAIQLQSQGKTAKTYYQLESYINNQRTELIEAYFNGQYNDYDIEEFRIKKGRAGIKPINGNYFITSETSKAFYKHKLFYKNEHFPENPFQLSKRKLKDAFNLKLVGIFKENGRKIYKIAYSPTGKHNNNFNGYIWIQIPDKTIQKITLECEHAQHHPFLPYGAIQSFSSVDMAITKTFQQIDNRTYIESMDFNYTLHCQYASGETRKYKSNAFIKPYDFEESFDLPLFNFSKSRHQDFRDITAMPYDKVFWENAKDFAINVGNKEKNDFIEQNRLEKYNAPLSIIEEKSPIYHFAYRQWQKKRLKIATIKDVDETKKKIVRSTHGDLEEQLFKYCINTKIFLDYNDLDDSTTYLLNAVIDPVGTFDNSDLDNDTKAFINMYFDLLEIQKRKLHSRLHALEKPTRQKITSLYNLSLEEFEKTIDKFTREVGHGKIKPGTEDWNQYINDNLGIDNIAHFDLFPPDKIYITGE